MSPSVDVDGVIHEYVASQKRLLELELRSEQEEGHNHQHGQVKKASSSMNDQDGDGDGDAGVGDSSSRILNNLQVDYLAVGLMGRTVVHMIPISNQGDSGTSTGGGVDGDNNPNPKAKKNQSSDFLLPAHRLKVGDEVEIVTKASLKNSTQSQDSSGASGGKKRNRKGGVITEVTETSISIALFERNHRGNATSSKDVQASEGKRSIKNKNTRGKSDQQADNNDDESDLFDKGPLTIVPRSSVDVHNKLIQGLEELVRGGIDHDPAGRVIRAIFSPDDEEMKREATAAIDAMELTPFNPQLDESQMGAIKFALFGNKPISLIHGPPGTGKTNSVAELILQAVHVHKLRVLVTAPSNVAVDNVLERIVSITSTSNSDSSRRKRGDNKGEKLSSLRMVRLGHPARIQPSIMRYSLETLVQNADGTEIVSDIREEMNSYLDIASKPKTRKMERRVAYREIKTLRKEIRQREEKVISGLMANAQVVFATNVGAANHILRKSESGREQQSFDLVIIDEAAQALEASCWIPILRGKRVVLAGDHKQLAPTIKSRNPQVQKELSRTLFERLMTNHKQVSRMLRIQYRMHESIANWASHAMYGGRLLSHDSVKARKLCHLPYISMDDGSAENDETSMLPTTRNASLLLVDTAGCDMFESTNAAGSRYNEGEAEIVVKHVRNLFLIGMKPEDIAIITPYNGQVEILRRQLLEDYPKLEIRSVDGFQGGEREVVVLSLVRSSDRGGKDGIGFLSDKRRLNVAVTRAKRQVGVICDTDTVSQNKFLKGLVDWMEENGEYVSAMEYNEDAKGAAIATSATIDVAIGSPAVAVEDVKEDEATHKSPMPMIDNKQESKSIPEKVKEEDKLILSEDEIMAQKEDLDERLNFFSEIADDGEELDVEVFAEPTILKHLDCLCKELSLKSKLLHQNLDKMSFVITPKGDDASEDLADANEPVGKNNDSGQRKDGEIASAIGRICLNNTSKPKEIETKAMELKDSKDISITDTHSMKISPKSGVEKEESEQISENEPPNMNNLLGALAKEREARLRASQPNSKGQVSTKISKASTGGKKKKKGGKSKQKKVKKDDEMDDLDDLAFLDAQIEKVQTSHGRKIDATGSNYKTIVNGILISIPKPKEKQRDSRAAGALSNKIKQAQASRRAKPKKK